MLNVAFAAKDPLFGDVASDASDSSSSNEQLKPRKSSSFKSGEGKGARGSSRIKKDRALAPDSENEETTTTVATDSSSDTSAPPAGSRKSRKKSGSTATTTVLLNADKKLSEQSPEAQDFVGTLGLSLETKS